MSKSNKFPNEERADKINRLIDELEQLGAIEIVDEPMVSDEKNEIQLFNNPEFGEIRSVMVDDEPWFVLKDVCAVLEIGSPHKVADRLDEDERSQIPLTDSIGRKQDTTIISESGLYTVIVRSDKPQATPFRKWVTSEVLPEIRKTGSYSIAVKSQPSVAIERELDIRDRESRTQNASIFLSIMEHLDTKSESYKQILMACAANTAAGQLVLPLPKCKFAKTYSAQDLARMFQISRNMVGRIANKNGLKCDKYGEFYHDVSANGKECDVFRYNDAAIEWFSDFLGLEPLDIE